MAAVQVAFIAQQQAAMQDSLFSFIFLIRRLPDTLPSEPVLTVSFPDWHLRLIPPRQFADEMTGNDLSVFLICRRQPFQCQRRDKEIKQEEIKWNTTCFQWRGKAGDLFIFFFLNTEARPNKIWYKEGLISLQGTLVEKHWEISFISALSGLPAVKQQQARSASNHHPPAEKKKPPVTRVRGLPISTSDWMLWFYLSSAASSGSWWQKWQLFAFNTLSLLHGSYKKKKIAVFVFVSHHRSPLLGCPKVFLFMNTVTLKGSVAFLFFFLSQEGRTKPPNISVCACFAETPLQRRSPQLHLLPGNSSLLSILSGSIEINWERVSSSEA